jgi:hypothetical protein
MHTRRAGHVIARPLNCGVRRMLTRIALFWLGLSIAITIFAVVSIYGFNYFEPRWGRGISLQVSMVIAGIVGVIGAGGFAVGLRFFGSTPPRAVSLAMGAGVAIALLLVGLVQDSLVSTISGRQLLVCVAAFALSLLAAWSLRRKRSGGV